MSRRWKKVKKTKVSLRVATQLSEEIAPKMLHLQAKTSQTLEMTLIQAQGPHQADQVRAPPHLGPLRRATTVKLRVKRAQARKRQVRRRETVRIPV